jgi:RNA polymerase sigma-70 factor (sigma-E family)
LPADHRQPPVVRDERAAVTFEEFLDAELTGLRRYATVLTGDPQRAHDVLADALLLAHGAWPRIGEMELPLAYVRRMVTNGFLSERRRWSSRHIRTTRSGELPDRPMPDPANAVDDREHLQHLLAGLPPRLRAVVVLRYYIGLSTDEIAAELGITAGAVRTAASRALATLRVVVTEEEARLRAGVAAERQQPQEGS